jgi:hypothetical protein
MALIADHRARDMLPADAPAATNGRTTDRVALKCRPAPSRRAPPTTMPYAICLRLAAAWIAALAILLAAVLTIRWYV